MYEEPLPHCPLLIINGNNASYKLGAKNVQDIRECSLDLVCKVQSTCCIIELSAIVVHFLYSKIQRVLSPLVVDCHCKSLRGTAAVTYNSDICNKNFVST